MSDIAMMSAKQEAERRRKRIKDAEAAWRKQRYAEKVPEVERLKKLHAKQERDWKKTRAETGTDGQQVSLLEAVSEKPTGDESVEGKNQ